MLSGALYSMFWWSVLLPKLPGNWKLLCFCFGDFGEEQPLLWLRNGRLVRLELERYSAIGISSCFGGLY